eukprot:15464073-Alexandrium_andersonii.AAC.1
MRALGGALKVYFTTQHRRIPGAANAIADVPSRQFAPVPEPFPERRAFVPRTLAALRSSEFYRRMSKPRARSA